jgi:hypothetical protein
MTALRIPVAIALVTVAGIAFAQGAGTGERGSTPPGMSQDGSRPGDGAVTGGSILPGESGGMPSGSSQSSEREINRCRELTGTLRDQCLRDARSSTGGTRAPQSTPPGPVGRDPVTAPPSQNPR